MDTKMRPEQPNEEFIVCLDEHLAKYPDLYPTLFCGQKLDGATGVHNHTIFRQQDLDLSRKRCDYDELEIVDRIVLKHDPEHTGDQTDYPATIFLIRKK